MQISQGLLATLIKENAVRLHAPAGIDGAKLLWAIAGNESAFGEDINPRHEPAYCPNENGRFARNIAGLSTMWGCWAHCSYGPWQLMFCNSNGVSPLTMANDCAAALYQTISFLNSYIFGRLGAKTIEQVGHAYNFGELPEPGAPEDSYVTKLKLNYGVPIP